MVKLVKHDLEFILKQIEIAEAHAAGGDLAALVAGYNGNDGLTQAHLLPYGLRTVDGSYNNLLPGRENWGASDQSFPGLFDPTYMNDGDGDRYDFNPSPVAETWFSNNNYANAGPGSGSVTGPGSGTVIDADPRIISNLIVDQTLNNPAAIAAALTHAGLFGQPLMTALVEIANAHIVLKAVPAPGVGEEPSAAYALAKAALDAALLEHGVEMDGNTVYLPNVSPDEGLSSPFNGWMTIFGQFFDHGLDLVAKGGNGTVYVPLAPDDPLYSTAPGAQNYIPLTRVSVNPGADGVLGTADDGAGPKNLTTPWVDQNQTYASTASKQVFMREYVPGPDGKPIASGLLLEGSNGGLATWADIKAQARNVLGIELTDLNVGNIPLIAADEYGNFIPGQNGYPQLVVGMGPDGQLGTADDILREGNLAAPVSAQGVVLTGHAFLDDIAHAAVPIVSMAGVLQADTDSLLGYANADGTPGPQGMRGPSAYDNELLDRHFIAGDGRANENIALTAVHQVFHSEHNRVVEMTKQIALDSGDLAFLNEWLLVDVTAIPTTAGAIAALVWDGERLFQAGRFTNEMEYQHLVFEEFGRMMQPDIDVFVFEPSADINPSIAAEFAHVVYRFGHSMLRQDIAVIEMDANGNPVQNDISLFDGFLNPVMYDSLGSAEEASGAIIRGMSRQTGSEIDEFVTDVLRNQLLGIPLDLATINIARGRDVGTPPLNAAREKFFTETGDTLLKPYESWADFALNMKNPASIINFIAAYGTHASVANSQANPKTVEQLRDAATKLVLGDNTLTGQAKIDFDNDRLDFLNATGAYAGGTLGGLNTVDFWMGGLAEKKMAFGGMLGSTFSFVFQMTMENLQDADRFYYLSRTQGLNLLNELENNTFAELVMRNTDLGDEEQTALPGNLFSAFQMPTLEMDISKQLGADPVSDDPFLGGFSKLVQRVDANNDGIAESIRVNSNEHFTIGGTENDDIIVSGGGDDAIWGRGGNDRIEAGYGVDKVFGGEGDDIITNAGTDIGEADFLHGNEGNDVIHGGSGLSLLFGNDGNDFIITGPDGKEAFGGTGDDFILGGTGGDFLLGNEGDDWLEGGQRFDTLAGENSELFFNSSIIGHDVLNAGSGDGDYDAESGDDIMFQNNEGIQRSNGMAGFDWGIHKGDAHAAVSDLGIPLFATQEAFILRDRFDLVEGLSGWIYDDTLTGRSEAVNSRAEATGTAAVPGPDSALDTYSNALLEKNVDLITGLRALVAHITRTTQTGMNGVSEQVVMDTADASDIILGGGGSDRIKGLAGNDVIDGDMWLNVRILVTPVAGQTWAAFSVDSLTELAPRMLSGEINPGQLAIVREIINGHVAGDVDTAVYTDARANYTFGLNSDDSLFVEHTGFVQPAGDDDLPETEEEALANPRSDGKDTVRGIEKLDFTDFDLNVIEGTSAGETLNGTAGDDLISGKDGNDILNGLGGNDILLGGDGSDILNGGDGDDILIGGPNGPATSTTRADSFGSTSYANNNGIGASFTGNWMEGGGETDNTPNNGDIRITGGRLAFLGENGGSIDGGESIQRSFSLAGATSATLTFDYQADDLDGGENLIVAAFNGSTWDNLGTLGGDTSSSFSAALSLSHTAIRFTAAGSYETGENFFIDNLVITATTAETLNGGLGNDTYIITLGDGNDIINEGVSATSGGTADRIVIRSTAIDPLTLLPILTGLNAFDNGGDNNDGDLVIGIDGQQITVVNHFDADGATQRLQQGVELINFSDATFAGYELGEDDYIISKLDDDRQDGGASLEVSTDNNFMVGENGVGDEMTGGAGNDLIFGGTGDNNLVGGAGDDLLVGGSGTGDDDILDGGTGADTMVGLDGNDTYFVDDDADVVVEAAGAGTDTVQTTLATYTLGANVENLTYTGAGAFIGTGNELANRIQGGGGVDTLTGFGGDDTYVVTAGDIIVEAAGGGTDTVLSSATYTLGAELENLTLTGNAAINGTGNNVANTITGNDASNQLFGGAGNDILIGNDGNDLLDGGTGDDTLTGGDDNDTIIGGEGNDTIDVGSGFNRLIYNAANFGADIVTSFDSVGGTAATQDLIDLSALGITAGNFANRVTIQDVEDGTVDDTLITVYDAAGIAGGVALGTIHLEELEATGANGVTAADFIFAAAPPPTFGSPTNGGNIITGNGSANTINGLGGNDTLSGAGGDDVINGGEGADTLNGGDGNDTLSGGPGIAALNNADNFDSANLGNSTGTTAWGPDWAESGDSGGVTTGQIRIDAGNNNVLQFIGGNGGDFNGAQIQRSVDLAGATAATLSYSIVETGLDAADDTIIVSFSRDGVTFVQVDLINDTTNTVANRTIDLSSFGTGPFTANAAIRFVASSLETGDSVNIDNLTINATGSFGIDTINGDAGDDTVIWNASTAAPTDGRDLVNGGTEGAVGDTFVINGNASAETYTIYTRAAFLGLAGNAAVPLAAATEIIVTRNGTNAGSIIAELSEIEEIRINGADPSGTGGTIAGDTFAIIGDFSTTSLRLNTITIDGDPGDDTVDISALSSAHRIVFRSNGGNDTIVGTLRPQDVIELPDGAVPEDYTSTTDANGVTTMSNGTHSICFTAPDGPPQVGDDDHGHGNDDDDDEDDDDDHHSGNGDDDDDDCDCDDDDDDETGTPAPSPSGSGSTKVGTVGGDTLLGAAGADNLIGLAGDDVLIGDGGDDAISSGEGADFVDGGAGRDAIQAGAGDDSVFAGADADLIHGEAGADRIFGQGGNDIIFAGAGNDTAVGGAGNDQFVGEVDDGNDVYFGDEIDGGSGIDTLDLSAITANLAVDLGNGVLGRGSAVSSQSGTDTLWSIENVATGSGNDTITASRAVNVIDGGAGNDTFRFLDAASAEGDTILDFEPGDRLDLSGMDANVGETGNQSFTLVSGPDFNAAAQLMVSYEQREGVAYTIVSGNVGGALEEDFRIELKGSHNLNGGHFTL